MSSCAAALSVHVARPGRGRHVGHGLRRALVLATGLAVLLHLGVWWGWQASRSGAWSGRGAALLQAPQNRGVAMQLRWQSPSLPDQARLDEPPPEPAQPLPHAQDGGVPEVPPRAAGAHAPDPAGRPGRAMQYLLAETLSDSPHPDAGWVLDEDVLAGVRQARLTLRLWVSAEGRIDRVALLSAEPAGDWAERAVQHLADTPMQPGLLAGRAVPSTLVVEIASEIERFR